MESFKKKKINVAFWGSAHIAVPLFHALATQEEVSVQFAVTQPDKKADKGKISESPIKQTARLLNIPVFQPDSLSDKNFYKSFVDADISLCILFAYGSIIPALLLDIPPLGWLNVHPSLLPKYRGASPMQWAIKNNDSVTGISLIQMDDGIDTGPLVAQWKLPLEKKETYTTLSDKVSKLAAEKVPQSILDFANHVIEPHDQPEEGKSSTRRLKKEDGRIDWKKPATNIESQIRAYNPWPGTHATFLNERIKILAAHEFSGHIHPPKNPGAVQLHDKRLIVFCGGGTALQIETIQRSGKKPQTPEDFVRGFPAIANGTFEL